MWRGPGDCLCSSPQEGSRAEETTPPRVPTPSSSLFPLEHPSPPPSTHPLHRAVLVLNPFLVKECHTPPPPSPHPSSTSPLPQPVSLAQMQVSSPQNMPPLPSHTVYEAGAGEGPCPRHMGSPFPSPLLGPGSVFSALGISPGGHGVEGAGRCPPPPPGKPLKNVYTPNRM